MSLEPIISVDRKSGMRIVEPVYASKFLHWAHQNRLGVWLTRVFLSRPIASRLYGWWHRFPWTRHKIRSFARTLSIDLAISTKPTEQFANFAEFFSREIDLAHRPIADGDDVCISPVDGRVGAYPALVPNEEFAIKGRKFNLRRFLSCEEDASTVEGGAMLVFRLHLADYHHFHFPIACRPSTPKQIGGQSYMVSPHATRWMPDIYGENRRTVTRLDTDDFGRVLMVEVGGFTVSSIFQRFEPNSPAAKGARKGYFGLGGSTVVLLFQPGKVHLDDDLIANTRAGHETTVNFGERVAEFEKQKPNFDIRTAHHGRATGS